MGNYFGFKKDNFKAIYIFQMMFAILISQCPVWRILKFFKMIYFGQPPGVQKVGTAGTAGAGQTTFGWTK